MSDTLTKEQIERIAADFKMKDFQVGKFVSKDAIIRARVDAIGRALSLQRSSDSPSVAWIPVSERLPDYRGVAQLVWVHLPKNPRASTVAVGMACYVQEDEPESYGEHRMTVGCWWANGRYYHVNDDRGYVTHWMPLPPPPGQSPDAPRSSDQTAAAAASERPTEHPASYPAIHLLKTSPRHWEVRIEVGKEWVTVIKEVDGDGGNSHIVEPRGIQSAIDAAMKEKACPTR